MIGFAGCPFRLVLRRLVSLPMTPTGATLHCLLRVAGIGGLAHFTRWLSYTFTRQLCLEHIGIVHGFVYIQSREMFSKI